MSEIQGTIRRFISAPIMDSDPTDPHNDRNHTQNYIVEAVNAEKQLWKLIHSKGLLHVGIQELYRRARHTCEKIILSDCELSELQNIEFSLWKLHYKHIDEYRNRIRGSSVTKERQNLAQVQNIATMHNKTENYLEGFNAFLSEATEFYHLLIKKIRRSYGLPEELLFFNGGDFSSSLDSVRMHRCQFSCHRCLVCLGDLARYQELYGNPDGKIRSWSVAAKHYLNASAIWPDSGNPHNQLAVLAIYVGDELLALYHCIRSMAVKEPFPDAWDNLILLFEKNRSRHLPSLCNLATFNFIKPSERSSVQVKAQSGDCFSNCKLMEATGDDLIGGTELWSLIVRMLSYFYVKPSLEDFHCVFASTIGELEALLLLDDARLITAMEAYQHMGVARTGPFRVLQLVSILIFTVDTLSESSKLEKAKHVEYMQQPSLIRQAFTMAFIFMGRLVHRCVIADSVDCSPLLPAILVFVEWLVNILDRLENSAIDEECASAMSYFFSAFADLLNQFDAEKSENSSPVFYILWEDDELLGFLPTSEFHGPLAFKSRQETSNGSTNINECQVRIHRIYVACMKIVNRSIWSQQWIFHEKTGRKFYTTESRKLPGRSEELARELPQKIPTSESVLPLQGATKVCEVPPSEDDEERLDVHETTLVEEEEVILFKPITRYNSAPLYLPKEGDSSLAASSSDSSHPGFPLHLPNKEKICNNLISNISGSSKKTLWEAPIPEDSVMESFELTDSPLFGALNAKSDEPPSPAGPPSLSAWVLNQDTRGLKDDIASASLADLSIGGNEVNQQNVKTTSAPAIEGDSGIVDHRHLFLNLRSPPYVPPVPSAPLLPDDAMWFTGSSSQYTDFNPDGYTPYPGQTTSSQQLNQYQVNLDRAHWYTPTTLGRFQDYDAFTTPLRDQKTIPSSLHPMKHLESPPFYPAFINGANEEKQERFFPAYPGPRPYGYGAVKDLRSEQQLLLKYLKEKEWHLQQEAQLRGSA